MFATIVIVFLLLALHEANKHRDEAPQAASLPPQQPQPQSDVFVHAFDMDAFMAENNIKAFYCSQENRVYWVQNVEGTMFCPNDSTLLYSC